MSREGREKNIERCKCLIFGLYIFKPIKCYSDQSINKIWQMFMPISNEGFYFYKFWCIIILPLESLCPFWSPEFFSLLQIPSWNSSRRRPGRTGADSSPTPPPPAPSSFVQGRFSNLSICPNPRRKFYRGGGLRSFVNGKKEDKWNGSNGIVRRLSNFFNSILLLIWKLLWKKNQYYIHSHEICCLLCIL